MRSDTNTLSIRDRRHWLPAALIGYFSEHPKAKLRESQVRVLRRENSTVVFTQKAEQVACSADLYRGSLIEGQDNDEIFRKYEDYAHAPVMKIKSVFRHGACKADDWIRVVHYIAMQFCRDPDYEAQIEADLADCAWPREQIDVGYGIDFPRFGAAILRAEWVIVSSPFQSFTINDRGISVCKFDDHDVPGYFIPLRQNLGIRIFGQRQKPFKWDGTAWSIRLPSEVISSDQARVLNAWTWASASEMAFGASAHDLLDAAKKGGPIVDDLGDIGQYRHHAALLGLPDSGRREDEWLLHSLASGIGEPMTSVDLAPTLLI